MGPGGWRHEHVGAGRISRGLAGCVGVFGWDLAGNGHHLVRRYQYVIKIPPYCIVGVGRTGEMLTT